MMYTENTLDTQGWPDGAFVQHLLGGLIWVIVYVIVMDYALLEAGIQLMHSKFRLFLNLKGSDCIYCFIWVQKYEKVETAQR